jgi:hypothetical protein
MPALKELLLDEKTTLARVTEHLRSLSLDRKIEEVTVLNKKCQARLWELARDGQPLSLDYLVPPAVKPLEPQPFEGKNSLPAFTRFQKVFYRTQDGKIAGYNNAGIGGLIGWGYYIAEPSARDKKELAVNYKKLPEDKPAGWPEIKPNTSGLSRFVYGNMIDFLRWVDEDVLIGKATRHGEKEMDNYFVLCRKNPRKK